jgi:SnoaL-like polyketide cyclase
MVKHGDKGILKVHGELQVELSIGKEDNKDISRSFLEDVWNREDGAVNEAIIDKLIAPTYVDHTPPCSLSSEELQGPEKFKQVVKTIRDNFFAIRVSIESQIAEDDRVVNLVTWQCTLKSDDDPPTAAQVVTVMGVGIDRIDEDGQIVEGWNFFDIPYRLINRLGLPCPLVPPGPAPTPPPCKPGGKCDPGYMCQFNQCRPI